MKRIFGQVVALLVTGLAVSAALPACAENDQSIFVRSALYPSTNRQAGACIYTDDPQQPQLFYGVLDVSVRSSYTAVLLVGNQMIPRGDPGNARAESMRAHLEGAIVRVTETNGATISEFTSYGTGIADPQNNNAPDYGLMWVTLIDAPTAAGLATRLASQPQVGVLARVKAFGKTVGGKELESDEFQFPIYVCRGCLLRFPAGTNDTTQPQPNCLLSPTQQGTAQAAPCEPGQDEGVDCTACTLEARKAGGACAPR